MNLKKCPFMGDTCEYHDCMLFNEPAAQCSISVIAVEMGSATANTGDLNDTLTEISNELPSMVAAVKGLV